MDTLRYFCLSVNMGYSETVCHAESGGFLGGCLQCSLEVVWGLSGSCLDCVWEVSGGWQWFNDNKPLEKSWDKFSRKRGAPIPSSNIQNIPTNGISSI